MLRSVSSTTVVDVEWMNVDDARIAIGLVLNSAWHKISFPHSSCYNRKEVYSKAVFKNTTQLRTHKSCAMSFLQFPTAFVLTPRITIITDFARRNC